MPANDKDIITRLQDIAAALETKVGQVAAIALRRDKSVAAQLRRIEIAVPGLVSQDELTAAVGGATSDRTISFVVQDPENIKTHAGRSTKSFPVWLNTTGFVFTISRVFALSDADDYAFSLYSSLSESDTSTGSDTLIGLVTCSTDGTSGFYADVNVFTSDTVANEQWIIFEHSSGSAETLSVLIEGTLA